MKYIYSIFRPSGNDTALVVGLPANKSDIVDINNILQRKHSNVEQVGFVYKTGGEFFLQMAGGEFCGNATRSAIFYFLNGREGNINIHSSGMSSELSGGINKKGDAWLTVPVNSNFQLSKKTVIKLEGITHVVVEEDVTGLNGAEKKKKAELILRKSHLLDKPASGVMFISRKGRVVSVEPIVWVRDIKTLYYETACGSGTMAFALYEKAKNDINRGFVVQPSGMSINFLLDNGSVTISGKVLEIKKDLEIEI